MEKENVIEIEFLPVWDKWAWRVTKDNLKYDEKNILEFIFNDEGDRIKIEKKYEFYRFMCSGKYIICSSETNLLTGIQKNNFIEIIRVINEKYGTQKLWRANKGEFYYYFNMLGQTGEEIESQSRFNDICYDSGNYFKTREEAEKYQVKTKEMLLNRELEEECNSEN